MDRLTPELFAHSFFTSAPSVDTLETRELDFNLARRSAVVVNQIRGEIVMQAGTTSGFSANSGAVQELDLDPDNVAIEFNALGVFPDDVVLDSSRVYRQVMGFSHDTAAGAVTPGGANQLMDWTNLRMEERPISITNMRHHFRTVTQIDFSCHVALHIKYFIVELSLLELGILNATRR